VEAGHYKIHSRNSVHASSETDNEVPADNPENRTISLIDRFLDTLPVVDEQASGKSKSKRKPTPADAAVDYVAYLLETEEENQNQVEQPSMRGQDLIDNFINNEGGKIELKENLEFSPQLEEEEIIAENSTDEGYFTETLARIYIKQGRYSKALEIIKRLNLIYPKKNAYFADQIRFLEKLIINSNKNK
jgi:hypothetical protein